jgi:hypothetical protein
VLEGVHFFDVLTTELVLGGVGRNANIVLSHPNLFLFNY